MFSKTFFFFFFETRYTEVLAPLLPICVTSKMASFLGFKTMSGGREQAPSFCAPQLQGLRAFGKQCRGGGPSMRCGR